MHGAIRCYRKSSWGNRMSEQHGDGDQAKWKTSNMYRSTRFKQSHKTWVLPNANNRGGSEPNAQCQDILCPRCQLRVLAGQTRPRDCQTMHIQHSIRKIDVQKSSIRTVICTRCIPGHHVRNVRRYRRSWSGWRWHADLAWDQRTWCKATSAETCSTPQPQTKQRQNSNKARENQLHRPHIEQGWLKTGSPKSQSYQNKEDHQRFVGMVTYLAKFIPNLSQTASPLRALLEKDTEWYWSQQQAKSFESLKRLITQAPVLK